LGCQRQKLSFPWSALEIDDAGPPVVRPFRAEHLSSSKGGIVEQSLMGTLAAGAGLLDPDADFPLPHQESAPLPGTLRGVDLEL
jgi:hypothetical protein